MKLIKKISWIIPALAISTAAFADSSDISSYCDPCKEEPKCDPCPVEPPECDPCYEKSRNKSYDQGYEICEGTLPKAYNAPGRIDICEGIDAYVTASFIYWEILGDQLELGTATFDTLADDQEYQIIKFSTDFEPGFKVGLGTHFSHDDWDLYAQYTRLHETETTTYTPNKVDFPNGLFNSIWPENVSVQFTSIDKNIQAKWQMELDKIDLELGRSYYLGTNLIARPFVGGSGHWLDQRYDYSFGILNRTTSIVSPQSTSSKNDSWAIGPRFGLGTNWIFYEGFRLFGYGAISLLFSENDVSFSGVTGTNTFNGKKVEKCIIRDVEEMMIGLGWGSYFTNDKWHMDLSVAYEAQRYSHTNYMATIWNSLRAQYLVKPGDLFLHGLTVTARFDF